MTMHVDLDRMIIEACAKVLKLNTRERLEFARGLIQKSQTGQISPMTPDELKQWEGLVCGLQGKVTTGD